VQIQPYFPEPITVRGNVAAERYLVTLGFIRRTMLGHFLTAVAVAVVTIFVPTVMSAVSYAAAFAVCLLALTVLRRILNGGPVDNVASAVLLVPCLWSLAGLVRAGLDAGHPVWIVGACYLVADTYAAVCGRDFSFVGQFMVTLFATVVLALALGLTQTASWGEALFWGAAGLGYVLFYVYDLAALLSRRRLGEEPAAVADLYRDLLNFTTYTVRIVLHWRRFRFI
jgi:hypothetical protein